MKPRYMYHAVCYYLNRAKSLELGQGNKILLDLATYMMANAGIRELQKCGNHP